MKKLIILTNVLLLLAVSSFAQKYGDMKLPKGDECAPKITENTKIVYVDKSPRTMSPQLIMSCTNFSDGIAAYHDPASGKWGTIDTLGNVVIPPKFTGGYGKRLPVYVNGHAIVTAPQGERGYHIIDKKGNIVKKLPNIAEIDNNRYTDEYVGVLYYGNIANGSKYGFIDYNGNVKFPKISNTVDYAKLPVAYGFKEGLSLFVDQKTKLCGYFDEQGNIAIAAQYSAGFQFAEGVAAVCNKDEKWGFIDTKGNTVIDFKFSIRPTNFVNGTAMVIRTTDQSVCVINKAGEIVKEYPPHTKIGEFNSNGTCLLCPKIYNTVIINTDHEVVKKLGKLDMFGSNSEPTFIDYGSFYVISPSGWTSSYITDLELNTLCEVYSIKEFHDGLAFVLFDDKRPQRHSAFVNPKGEIVILFKYNEF